MEYKQTDILIVGGGLAAIRSAVTAARSGLRVLLITKTHLCGGASFYPGMDRVACLTSTGIECEDEQYLQEILDAGQGMADEKMNRIYIQNIRHRVAEFPEIGVMNASVTEPRIACFAQTARPTYSWNDWKQIRSNLRSILQTMSNVEVMEYTFLVSILQKEDTVNGAVIMRGSEQMTVACKSLVLATGGMGDLYEYNLNTPDVSGDGQALALKAGASLINVEFMQFIPGFVSPAYKTVFRETTIPYLTGICDAAGNDLLKPYLPDEADREACMRLRSTHGPFTARLIDRWFDIAMMNAILAQEDNEKGFAIRYRADIAKDSSSFVQPYVQWLKTKHGVDLAQDEVYIAPFFHAANGGIHINEECQTRIRGLFACGEASGGIHGADRLGGHSTGSCLVFGHIAGESAVRHALGTEQRRPQDVREALHRDYAGKGMLTPNELLPKIRRLMFRTAGVVREGRTLAEGREQMRLWQQAFDPLSYFQGPQRYVAMKTAHFLTLGQALLHAMEARTESRGSHYRKEHPYADPNMERRHGVHLVGDRTKVFDA